MRRGRRRRGATLPLPPTSRWRRPDGEAVAEGVRGAAAPSCAQVTVPRLPPAQRLQPLRGPVRPAPSAPQSPSASPLLCRFSQAPLPVCYSIIAMQCRAAFLSVLPVQPHALFKLLWCEIRGPQPAPSSGEGCPYLWHHSYLAPVHTHQEGSHHIYSA